MKQKVWLITGVSKGLGREIAQQAAEQGNIVIGTVRREEDRIEFEKKINAVAYVIDLTNIEQIPSLIDRIAEQYGRIDVLVNNAGFGIFGMIEEFEADEIINQFNVNFISVWKLCQSVLPYMREKGQGTIVQISSRLGITAGIGNGIYAASKFAVEGMSEALRREVEPFGIKVLLVEPGALRTDFFGASVKYAENELTVYTERLNNVRENTKSINGRQPGDPIKAAGAIISTVNTENPVFRLPLTSGTIETLKTKVVEFQNCIEATEAIAKSIDY